jgi:tetratricopeptide (TPR) repeat protein
MKRHRSTTIALLLLGVAATFSAAAQEPNALEQASPCKDAADQAEQRISRATDSGEYNRSLADLKRTVEAFVARTGESEEASLHCMNYDGAALLHLGEYGEAGQIYRRATAVARQNFGPDDDSTLTLQGNLAVALMHIGSLEEADRLLRDTLAHREVLEDTPKAHKLAITLLNLAMVDSSMGEIGKSREFVDRGWAIAQKAIPRNDPGWSNVLDDYALVLDQAGSRSEAREFFEQALADRIKNGDEEGAVESLSSLAASFYDVGEIEEADRRYDEAYALAKRVFPPLHPTLGEIARSWCRVLSSVDKLEESLARCDDALKIESAHGDSNRLEMYRTQVNRGVTLGELERYTEAIDTLRAASDGLRRDFPAYRLEALEAMRSLAVVLVDAARLDEGAALLAEALNGQRAALGEMHPDVLLTQGNYGVVLAIQGKFPEAEAILTDYAKKADVVRGLYGSDERATRGVFSRFASTRMFLAKVLISEGRCQDAFDWIEETKSRSLRDRIRDHVSFGTASAHDQELFSSLNQTRTRLYSERAQSLGNGAAGTEIDGRLRELDAQIGKLIDKARDHQRSLSESTKPSAAMSKAIGNAKTTIGSFGIVEDEVLVSAYGRDSGFQCTTLGHWNKFNDTMWTTHVVESTIGGMSGVLAGTTATPASRVIQTGSRSFAVIPRASPIPANATIVTSGDEVLGAVGDQLMQWLVTHSGTSDRLVLSPDGLLSLVALDALTVNGQPLIKRFSLSQVDSFAPPVVDRTHSIPAPKNRMIAFGDPVYSASAAAQGAPNASQRAQQVLRGDFSQDAEWPSLPSSGPELRALSSLFGLIPKRSLFSKTFATAQNLEVLNSNRVLEKAQYVVFSAHAFADLSNPELSSIVLSVPPGGKPRDAYITSTDVAALNLNADLVYFSACETGFGQVVTGEGVLSLSSAALIAGAHATVHTLWSVADASSAEFTRRFFLAIHNGSTAEQALTNTKRAFLKEKRLASPAYWAPYVLVQPKFASK